MSSRLSGASAAFVLVLVVGLVASGSVAAAADDGTLGAPSPGGDVTTFESGNGSGLLAGDGSGEETDDGTDEDGRETASPDDRDRNESENASAGEHDWNESEEPATEDDRNESENASAGEHDWNESENASIDWVWMDDGLAATVTAVTGEVFANDSEREDGNGTNVSDGEDPVSTVLEERSGSVTTLFDVGPVVSYVEATVSPADDGTGASASPESSQAPVTDGDATDGDEAAADAATVNTERRSVPGSLPVEGLALSTGTGVLLLAAVTRQGLLSGLSAGPALAAMAPAGVLSDTFDRLVRAFTPLRYSRYDDSDPLEHDRRREVFEAIETKPGTYLSEVSDAADLPLSTARHHVRVLEREDLVASAKVRGKRRFYPDGTEEVELAAAMDDEPTAAVLDALARLGPSSVATLADELGRDSSTVTHHLQRLDDDDLVQRERDGRTVVNRLAPAARRVLDHEPVEADAAAVPADD